MIKTANQRFRQLPIAVDGGWRRPKSATACRTGFTLIELLAVIAIIGILVMLVSRGVLDAIKLAHAVACKNNLRSMFIAASAYADDNRGEFPPAYIRDFDSQATISWENIIWRYDTRSANDSKVHQCPSFKGSAMWEGDRYTGYNYNSSYIGGVKYIYNGVVASESIRSARFSDIKDPSKCAVFGDGEYASGANKFMRSPYPGPLDIDASTALAGTQGFRHYRKTTNVAFADGSVQSLYDCYTKTAARGSAARNCGFLSEDNSLYDLE